MPEKGKTQLPPVVERKLVDLASELGTTQTELDRIDTARKSEVASAEARAEKAAKPLHRKRKRLLKQYEDLLETHENELFAEAQHFDLPGGHQIGRQASSEADVSGKPAVVASRLKRMGLDHLIRDIHIFEPDRSAIRQLKNRPSIIGVRGIRVAQFMTFWVKPAGYRERINGRKRRVKKN